MDTLTQTFEERLQEIDVYIELLEALDRQVQQGPPKLGGSTITGQQQKILYSSVYLQLYNLVEATVTWCIDAVAAAAADSGKWSPADLSDELQREWVRVHARTHVNLTFDHRLESAVSFFNRLTTALPVSAWSVEAGGGGNWDDREIEDISVRLGCDLQLSQNATNAVKRIIRDDKSVLRLVRDLRNRLAHGTLSFSECGDGVTVKELRDLKDRAALYLREVVAGFRAYIDGYKFLTPSRRPITGVSP